MTEVVILSVPLFSTLCNEAFKLRRSVFISEQNVPADEEFDEADLSAHHIVAIQAGEVADTLRIVYLDDHVKIGRVAVGAQWRGHGIASAMIRFAMEAHCAVRGNRFYLTAQSDKVALYEKFGFTAFGDEFLDGGMPHLAMRNY
ncbi:GNAT family N-acetyltransferase [Rhizobium azibense]|uniref:Putative GNAT family N-acyltransferase n=1 Tax=Rhizobium azibense TaxID=1136135 RepID=A0A4R3RRI9_9HYPH|nr:GNAT family N-acetyltransferase [Rhizobium azibense]TCU34226.1 putative GNAT family N-acyltransferase [Rhizobium azibense]